MMLGLAIAAAVAVAAPAAADPIAEAQHAIAADRIDQAKAMTAEAIAKGANGGRIERLLADLAFASGDNAQALARFETLSNQFPTDPLIAERAGIAALRLRQSAKAALYLERAAALPGATWRAWNALGVAADWDGNWAKADEAYAKARQLAPRSAEVANNQGWSLLLRGRWGDAITPLAEAAALDPSSTRIAANLELARAAEAENLPTRRKRESNADWAARLNDAGFVAWRRGDRKRAVAAFAQAIEVRSEWFDRAANNLAAVEAMK